MISLDKKDKNDAEKNNKNEEQENNLGTALRNKIVIKEIIIFLFQAENMIDGTAEYISKSYIEKIFFCLK